MLKYLATAVFAFSVMFGAGVSTAQEQPPATMLVLDASGSMWGPLGDGAKITVAQEVIGELLSNAPADQVYGLASFGHRSKTSCDDVQVLVPPAAGTGRVITSAVGGLSPQGKSPLIAALQAAAGALDYQNTPANIILIADGTDTCQVNPCKEAADLEAAGKDLTVNVIGIGVGNDLEVRAQLACLAENTGGQFLSAADSEEFRLVLGELTGLAKPVAKTEIRFMARDGSNGPVITEGLLWTVHNLDTGKAILASRPAGEITLPLAPGTYQVAITRIEDSAQVAFNIPVTEGGPTAFALLLPNSEPLASLKAPAATSAGAEISVEWTGPEGQFDYISVALPESAGNEHISTARVNRGNPLTLRMPSQSGTYEIRYILGDGHKILARQTVTINDISASVEAPATAAAGDTILVKWDGPDYQYDYISVAKPGSPGAETINTTRTDKGASLPLMMPPEPGEYEIRYVMYQDRRVLASVPITVTEVAAKLRASATATINSTISVKWDGPDYLYDYIAIAQVGGVRPDPDNPGATITVPDKEIFSARTEQGNPLKLKMPAVAGQYELRYVMFQGHRIIARKPIEVTEVAGMLEIPQAAVIGETINVGWNGPGYQYDYIAVTEIGAPPAAIINNTRTSKGNPLPLVMPPEPGQYEIRYVVYEGRKVLASREISVLATSADISAPPSGGAGQTVTIAWEGPDYESDFISVAPKGSGDAIFVNSTPTAKGNPLKLTLPIEPGEYEIRYIMYQGRKVLDRQPIMVTPVDAAIYIPETAYVGENLLVNWVGPGFETDYISVVQAGAPDLEYLRYAFVSEGSPLRLKMPGEPGEYELRYIQNDDSVVLASAKITLEPVDAELIFETPVLVGQALIVDWNGPGYERDLITIARKDQGANDSLFAVNTSEGSPLTMQMPTEPGLYELRYILGEEGLILAKQDIVVDDVSASLITAGRGKVGEETIIEWAGPDYAGDYITIVPTGTPDTEFGDYIFTSDGSPVLLTLPPEPGEYEIRYVMFQGPRVLARQTFVVDP